ncbi:MAG: PKD domain-containing protein, partial [Anaerolineae bacterium]|nr:PKD domain-containing protein [Anaerolineae bacterium]
PGTDYFTYPFPWLKMDNEEVEIIAAADGTIIFKRDGQYDRQCALSSAQSNAVVLRHADGTYSQYLHMKKYSLTTKGVGASVGAGEYLGIVGSSGSSTGPHLHFEVRDTSYQPIDPFEGPCNTRPSMWADQLPYYDSAVIAVHTGSGTYVRPPCPQQETTNIKTVFDVDDTVYFISYYRDLLDGQQSTFRIKKPDGSTYRTRTFTMGSEHYEVAYWYWAKDLDDDGPPPHGTWTFEVDFEGVTYDAHFYVGGPVTITIKTPNGSEAWKPGTFRPIAWDTNLEEDSTVFWIDLYKNDVFHSRIYTATPSSGFYFWGILGDLPPGDDYKVKISDSEDINLYDWSDNAFTIAPNPDAQFTYHPISGSAPLTVTFTDTSTSLVDGWLWEFGDGGSSHIQDPTHIYPASGIFTISLTVTGPTGSDAITRTRAVTVTPPALSSQFHAEPLLGSSPMTVQLTDDSAGPPIVAWEWSFGDSTTSTLQHPTHTYTQPGQYTVSLLVRANEEEDLLSKANYIRVVDQMWWVYVPLITR